MCLYRNEVKQMRSPTDYFRGDMPYESYEEYLNELSVLMIVQLKQYLIEKKEYYAGEASSESPAYMAVLQILDGKLKAEGLSVNQDVQEWKEMIAERLALCDLEEEYFALDYVTEKLVLNDFGKTVLLFSMMATLDISYHRVFQYLNEDETKSHPTLELCGRICRGPEQSLFDLYHQIYGQMNEYRILFPNINESKEYMTQELVCDDRLLEVLLGNNRRMPSGVDILEPDMADPLWFREEETKELESFTEDKNFPLFVICGERGAGKKHFLRYYAKEHSMHLVLFDASAYERMGEEGFDNMITALRYAVRECVFWTMPLVVQGIDEFAPNLIEQLLIRLKDDLLSIIQLIFVLRRVEQYTPETTGIYILPLRKLNGVQRIELWNYYKEGYLLGKDIVVEEVANTFLMTPGQIKAALNQASIASGGIKKEITKKVLYQACYEQLHHRLSEKTEKVKPAFSWEDLKMRQADKQILSDICACVKNRHTVMTKWNFEKIVPYGAGITVLFAGPPGTGKTMAAQVIANELQMELYKIDLSQVIDKYVGETEKNIKMIFEQAQKSNSILFFDEADAIFNKRLEASNANERFANIESSLLLQCVESYGGISILATNHFHAIDAAFIRRFKYYIMFREPDEETRYEIWRAVFPTEAPLAADVDLRLLAKLFEFTGAIIKNIALAAAYLAAEQQTAISNVHILKATRREMQKSNLILTKEKLGSLGYLFAEIIE